MSEEHPFTDFTSTTHDRVALDAPYSYAWAPARPKFQHRYWVHVLLLLATLVTTSVAGATDSAAWAGVLRLEPAAIATFLASGLSYSIPLLLILGSHEFGHYLACRYHDVDATLPYFIPAPLPLTGTLGAVIRIREAFPSKKALFDIGVAGPLAGFVALLPFLVWGVAHSQVVVIEPHSAALSLGEPLLFKLVEHLTIGALAPGLDVNIHPVAFAAWFGMLATALNLLPFGQLDGGHIAYALAGRRAGLISALTLGITLALTVHSVSWLFTALMMLAMAFFLGIRHPRIVDEDVPLDPRRTVVALVAFGIFIVCFTPVPIEPFLR